MKEYIKQFFYLLDAQAKKAVPLLLMAFVISSILDIIGIGLIGMFLGLLINPHFLQIKFPHVALFQSDFSEKKLILVSGLLIVVAFAVKAVISLFIQTRVVSFCQSLSLRLKTRMMHAFQSAPYVYHVQKNSTVLLSHIQESINNYIMNVLQPTFILISNSFIAIAILIFLGVLHPILTIFLLLMFTLLGCGYDFYAKRHVDVLGKTVAHTASGILKNIQQGLYGLTEIRVLGKEPYFLNQVTQVASQYTHAYGVLTALQQMPRYLVENLVAIFIVALSLGGIAMGIPVSNIVAMAAMFAAAGARLLPSVSQSMTSLNQIRGSAFHMQLIYDDLIELDALLLHAKLNLSDTTQGKQDFKEIQLDGVSYQYPEMKLLSLVDVNLKILRGQSIGLIGTSGAGKSTLVNVILGFLEPCAGQVLIDGKPLTHLRPWLNNIAYIPQTIFLLDDTLCKNIALGVEDDAIDEARLQNAVNMAQLSEVVINLPQGLNTTIGENGVRLSGGQRQRVALARAFYHERDVIIMDEATSSLDDETEAEVIDTIQRLKGDKTLIVIAHRLSTIEHCDKLYRFEKGRVVAEGSYQDVVGGVLKM